MSGVKGDANVLSRNFCLILATGLSLTLPQRVQAQDGALSRAPVAALPDPTTIETPPIASADPKVISEGYKFFYFYSPDVSFAQAYADIAECRSFLRHGVYPPQAAFVPWIEPARRPIHPQYYNPYGIVGAMMAAIIVPKINRGLDNNMLRRCMEPRGYKRFPLPENSWEALNQDKDEVQNILKQAKLAALVKPVLPEVTDK